MTLDPTLLRVIELARELPADVPGVAHREEVRAAILARASAPIAPRRSRATIVVAVALVAAAASAIGYLAMRDGASPPLPAIAVQPPPVERARPESTDPTEHHGSGIAPSPSIAIAPRTHGHVHARPGAELGAGAPSPDEIVRLVDGTIDLEVDPLEPGERFRVIVGASEIEVRGTAFTVVAERDRLVDVKVAHGRVDVRPAGSTLAVLDAGGSWHAAAPRLEVVPPKPLTDNPPAPRTPADQLAYDDAWTALRERRFHDAGAAFARALALAPEGPLADDARFWHAVALAREPRAAEAMVVFRELLDEHPGTAHHNEASAMLGWLLVDAKQLPEARTRFEAAASDPSEKVRASARAGLAALPL